MRKMIKRILRNLKNVQDSAFNGLVSLSVRLNGYRDYIRMKPSSTKEERQAIKQYWKRYTHKNHKFFQILYSHINGEFSPKYIPYDLYITKIDKYLNDERYLALDNKCYYPMLFDCKLPQMLFMRINGIYYNPEYKMISFEEASQLAEQNGKAIFKPATVSGGGTGVKIWHKGDKKSPEEIMHESFGNLKDYVCQDVQKQHEDLARIHENSLNTIRIYTLFINNKIEVLSCLLRMGANGGFIDNVCKGGVACGIDGDGRLKKYGYPESAQRVTEHPQAGKFTQYTIPSFEKAKDLAKRQAEKFPYFRLIAWDIAIDPEGEPVLVEANFAKGGLTLAQYTNGPLFGEFTDAVLDEVFHKK